MNFKKHLPVLFLVVLLSTHLTGCHLQSGSKIVSPPPYSGTPIEINTYEIKGLRFVKTVSFNGMFAEQEIANYAKKHHIRYYVVTLRRSGSFNDTEKVSAMMYQ